MEVSNLTLEQRVALVRAYRDSANIDESLGREIEAFLKSAESPPADPPEAEDFPRATAPGPVACDNGTEDEPAIVGVPWAARSVPLFFGFNDADEPEDNADEPEEDADAAMAICAEIANRVALGDPGYYEKHREEWLDSAMKLVDAGVELATIPAVASIRAWRGSKEIHKFYASCGSAFADNQVVNLYFLWKLNRKERVITGRGFGGDVQTLFGSPTFDMAAAVRIAKTRASAPTKAKRLGLSKRLQLLTTTFRSAEADAFARGVQYEIQDLAVAINDYLVGSSCNRDPSRSIGDQAEELICGYQSLRYAHYTATSGAYSAVAIRWFEVLSGEVINRDRMKKLKARLEKIRGGKIDWAKISRPRNNKSSGAGGTS